MRSKADSPAPSASMHQLKVTLEGVTPPIWRRVLVPSAATLADLHNVIQIAMGWEDDHLHQFEAGKATYSAPGFLDEFDVIDKGTVRLDQVMPRKRSKLRYEYDFGDSWEHTVVVEAIAAPEADGRTPVCLAGERAGPPEDCGGVWGYAGLLDALADPSNPEYEEMMEWLGPFDPEAFDLEAVNKQLAKMGRR